MNKEFQPPSSNQIANLVSKEYNLSGMITRLSGENENFLIETPKGQCYVIQIKPPMVLSSEDVDMVVRCMGEELALLM